MENQDFLSSMKHCPVNEAYQYSSPLISLDIFKEQCLQNVGHDIEFKDKQVKKSPHVEQEEIAKFLQTDAATVGELEEVCNVDKLNCDYDNLYDYHKLRAFEDFPDDSPLQIVKLLKQGKTKQEELHYVPNFPDPCHEDLENEEDTLGAGEVLLRVAVYHADKKKIQQEFYVVADQSLTELRDLITCSADNIVYGEFSNNPDLTGVKTAKELTESSFFCIEQCFYNDTRNPLNRDYSKIIIEWAKAAERYTVPGLGLFQSELMQDACFRDLKIRLGYPYLFCHQGNCEHIVVFTDMRLISEDDPKKRSSYPFRICIASKRVRRCSICKIHMIKWMTMNDSMAFENPSFFCEKCFRYLHYSKDGKKLGTFEAYPYVEAE